jgi:hypothetical protein
MTGRDELIAHCETVYHYTIAIVTVLHNTSPLDTEAASHNTATGRIVAAYHDKGCYETK